MAKKPNNRASFLAWGSLGLLLLISGRFLLSSKPDEFAPPLPTATASQPQKISPLKKEGMADEIDDIDDLTSSPQPLFDKPEALFVSPPKPIDPFEEGDSFKTPIQYEKESQAFKTTRPNQTGAPVNSSPHSNTSPPTEPVAPVLSALPNQVPQSVTNNLGEPHSSSAEGSQGDTTSLTPISLNKSQELDRVSLDPNQPDRDKNNRGVPANSPITESPGIGNLKETGPLTETSPPLSTRERLLASGPSQSPSLDKKPTTQSLPEEDNEEDDSPPFPSAEEIRGSAGGEKLSLAKPYCFLLPTNSPAIKCAMESVNLIVKEYARAGVRVVPVFRWWGNNYSNSPALLEEQATKACNLEKAFPWIKGGKQVASIQAFVRHPIPSVMCGKDPEKDPVSGCSNLCPSGRPSFSTVSEKDCSAGVSLHESGHSNCCAAQCKNTGDCKPPPGVDAGCGLCLEMAAQIASNRFIKEYLASKAPSECKLTAAALASIRAGASLNPGYTYHPEKQYRPRGKPIDSIFGEKDVKKLLRGFGDTAEGEANTEGTPMSSDSGSSSTRRRPSASGKATSDNGEDPVAPAGTPSGYSEGDVKKMVAE